MQINADDHTPEIIDILSGSRAAKRKWVPNIGSETLDLLQTLGIPEPGKSVLRDEAVEIMARCLPPGGISESRTGLVVGYVQSGKTMSFTTVAALARDNHFPLVIVITGISEPLLVQSTERLQTDLRLRTRPDREWLFLKNPSRRDNSDRVIASALSEWNDPTVPEKERRTVLIAVMKNHSHLGHLIEILDHLQLDTITALIVDDEADQASLNTLVKQGDQSTTYRRLMALRQALPRHTFLQYTATPQAPLLINIIDVLSPNFARVLSPGTEYVGAREFFLDYSGVVKIIPDSEIRNVRGRPGPPESLLEAMMLFFLGVAAGLVLVTANGNRSMLVHPSHKTKWHSQYFRWVSDIKSNWETILQLPDVDRDAIELDEDFRKSYNHLAATVANLPLYEDLKQRLLHAMRRTWIVEVNSRPGKTPLIDWSATYAYILVGGQAMDRGFTVKGLTVTYMPRGTGVANADTVQQRARFFGYKKSYIGYCRVFLQASALAAYRSYVIHEEDIRMQLANFDESGKPLSDWKRAFFLTRDLKPTRESVLDLDYMRGSFADSWYSPRAPHDSDSATSNNEQLVRELQHRYVFSSDLGNPRRTEYQQHQVSEAISLREIYDEFLTRLRIARPIDSQRFTGLLIQLGNYLESHADEKCTVYLMSHPDNKWITRQHTRNDQDEIENLFQGEYPVNPIEERGTVYPGDRNVHEQDTVTIQVHRINVLSEQKTVVAADVPTVTVWVPRKMSADWLVQDRQGS